MTQATFALLERSQALPPSSRALMGLTVAVLTWEMRHRTRASLAKLDDHMLGDIGLTRHDAEREVGKPFWGR